MQFWRDRLDIIRDDEPLHWVFREDLRVGSPDEDERAVTVTIRSDEARQGRTDAASVYDAAIERGHHDLCFELLYAAPDRVFATLRDGCALEPLALEAEAWRLTFQLAPSFHAVAEVDDPRAWREIARRTEPSSSSPLLRGVMRGDPTSC